jgi:hypothetical protein
VAVSSGDSGMAGGRWRAWRRTLDGSLPSAVAATSAAVGGVVECPRMSRDAAEVRADVTESGRGGTNGYSQVSTWSVRAQSARSPRKEGSFSKTGKGLGRGKPRSRLGFGTFDLVVTVSRPIGGVVFGSGKGCRVINGLASRAWASNAYLTIKRDPVLFHGHTQALRCCQILQR